MGSRRLITVLLVCLFIYNDIKNVQANAGNLQEERHEYQYQRSSKVVGGSGYYNSRSGNAEESSTNLEGWTQNQRDQVQGMAEKLRSELNTAQPGQYYSSGSSYSGSSVNGQGCSKICALVPGFIGGSQEEIDLIAKDMTAQIIADLRSGKLVRSQMNQPNWFEHQVAQKLIELRKHHDEQYQQNVYRAASRFRENQGSQVQPSVYVGGNTYTKDSEDVQQQQENVFSNDDLRQVQQSVFDQRQQQQQGSFYQQQSQNQHTVYTRPVHRYYNSQTTSRDSANEERIRTVYPTPVVVTNNVMEEKNYTSSSSRGSVPQINVYNQYGHRDEESEDRQYTQTQEIPTVVPSYDRTYYTQKEYEERQRNGYRPITYPTTSQTVHTSQTTSERERTTPVVIPTQRTITSNVHVEQEEKEVRRRPQMPRVYNYGREEKTEERETYHRNRQNVVPPTQRTTYEVRNTEQEQKTVEVHTPSPVPATSSKHSIYNHVAESEVVPNYQPRVVIDKNTEFEVLDHRREKEYRPRVPVVPVTQTQTTIHESEQEERRRQHIPIQRPSQTTYREQHNELEENEVHVQVTPRYQPGGTSQHVITSETEETRTSHSPRPYPVSTSHSQTVEQNQSSVSTTHGRRPSYPIYPSFKSNTTTFENGDSYIRSESHIPTTYVIELTVEEYEERLHRLRDELIRLGYGRLTDEEYNSTIASGGFTHNGYKYIYNAGSGRFEKTSKIEVNDEEYEVIYETLQQKLREIGFGSMCDQEVQQAIKTGVFIRGGNKFVYNAGREQYDRIQITQEERREIFARIQELLRRLGYRLLTQKENEGVLINGHFIRAAHQWIYNIVDGTVVKTIYVGDFAEFTDDEYREIYQKIQDTLRQIGYAQMSEGQCNATITSGTFERGGIYWSYNPMNGQFERILLSQEEYRERMHILREELRRLGHRELSAEEYRKIIYQGYFHHGGYRYEYVKEARRYERIELSQEEYRERLRQLRDQLIRIGYGTMSESECNSTITSGKFYYGGYEWVYNFDTRDYQMGNKSDIDQTVASNAGQDTTNFDTTKYDSTKAEEAPISTGHGQSQARRQHGIISKNRGDQPPQHFDEDYESDEILEEEPGMGYYPTGKKPEIGLATPEPFEQIRETTALPTTMPPQYNVPSDYQRDRHRHEQQLTTQIWPTQPETISERRYHRKQTTYTQTTGLLPQQVATQRSMRHVPGNEFEDDREDDREETSTPFEPIVVSTQAYLVGNERPYNPNDQSGIIERYLRNERHRPAAVEVNTDDYNHQQQEVLKAENLEDLGQQYEDFNGQHEEDVQQQLIDMDAEAEDLRQQQVDISHDDRNSQQRIVDNYGQHQESNHKEYNSHYHGEKVSADEYEAEVVQVTDKVDMVDMQTEESPGLWTRFKDKTKEIFG